MTTITITLSDSLVVDGWIEAANRNESTPEAMATEFLTNQGLSYANLFGIGIITSAAFIARLTADEYAAIMAAAEQSVDVASLVSSLISTPTIQLNDPRVEQGLEAVAAAGLIAPERIPELLSYGRPVNGTGE